MITGKRAIMAVALVALGCHGSGAPQRGVSAEFGVIFGGEVQERQTIALETDRAKQTVGFRITSRPPFSRAHFVQWELNMPGTTHRVVDQRGRAGEGRLVRLGFGQTRPGAQYFEQVTELRSRDPLGTWNVRVLLDGLIVLDRPFLLSAKDD